MKIFIYNIIVYLYTIYTFDDVIFKSLISGATLFFEDEILNIPQYTDLLKLTSSFKQVATILKPPLGFSFKSSFKMDVEGIYSGFINSLLFIIL